MMDQSVVIMMMFMVTMICVAMVYVPVPTILFLALIRLVWNNNWSNNEFPMLIFFPISQLFVQSWFIYFGACISIRLTTFIIFWTLFFFIMNFNVFYWCFNFSLQQFIITLYGFGSRLLSLLSLMIFFKTLGAVWLPLNLISSNFVLFYFCSGDQRCSYDGNRSLFKLAMLVIVNIAKIFKDGNWNFVSWIASASTNWRLLSWGSSFSINWGLSSTLWGLSLLINWNLLLFNWCLLFTSWNPFFGWRIFFTFVNWFFSSISRSIFLFSVNRNFFFLAHRSITLFFSWKFSLLFWWITTLIMMAIIIAVLVVALSSNKI